MSLHRSITALSLLTTAAFAAEPPAPKFRAVTIDDKIQIGYGLAVADVDGDRKPDILLADKKQFVWYKNPTWEKYVIAENLTEKDNVCLAAQDLDGDGKCELAVGAEWNPADTEKSGAVFYLIAPADRTQKWEAVKFPSVEPTTHRMKWLKLDGDKWGLVVVPLHGRGNKNGEGAPVKVLCYVKPADPRDEWKAEVVDESMHMTHNFDILRFQMGTSEQFMLLIGGREGVQAASRTPERWKSSAQQGFQSTGEVRYGAPTGFLTATIEPMHGNMLVANHYATRVDQSVEGWFQVTGGDLRRHVLTDQLTEGHALACGDVLGTKNGDQIVVGWRGNPQKPQPVGIKLFAPLDAQGEKWRESLIDDNGMACEDLVLADLDGDGKLDIVASGRATKNVKIYFNETAQ